MTASSSGLLAGFRLATRLNSFGRAGRSANDLREVLAAVARVPGLTAVELNYPQHVAATAIAEAGAAIAATGLTLTGLNLRFDDPAFAEGAFTHPSAAVRARAVDLSKRAVDEASRLGAGHVILWMGPDGFDTPFHVDYDRLWGLEVDGFRQVAAHLPSVRVSVEYKPNDPRRVSLIRSMGEALLAARDGGLPNFGVTLDFCHSLMAGEQPAAAAALALREGRLFGVHLNDGYGPADDGLPVGTVHPWQTLDLLWRLRTGGYDGTIYFDTFPERVDPAAEAAANVRTILRFARALDRLDPAEVAAVHGRHDALGARELLHAALSGAGDG